MSERVSDERLENLARGPRGIYWSIDMSRELLEWRALGESPEAVRHELDSLRMQSYPVKPLVDARRPTFAEALDNALCCFDHLDAPITAAELSIAVNKARRESGELP